MVPVTRCFFRAGTFFTFLFIFHPFLANDFILNRSENILKTFINLLLAFSIILTDAFSNKGCVKSVHIRSYFSPHFSRIWTEYGEIRRISPYSVRMREMRGKYGPE